MTARAAKILEVINGPKLVLFYRSLSSQSDQEADFLIEGGLTMPLGQNWSARMDRGLQPNQQDHLHVMKNGRDICIINRDGSPSHNTNIDSLPSRIRGKVRSLGLVYIEESRDLIDTANFGGRAELAALIKLFWIKAERGY